MYLPDLNLWLALAFEVHRHHPLALAWFEAAESQTCFFCRFTQQGLLRLATNPAIFREDALSMLRAWSCYDRLVADERVSYRDEPADVEECWRQYTVRRRHSHRAWSDAYLAAFAVAGDLELVTFDRGFRDYRGLRVTVLDDPS